MERGSHARGLLKYKVVLPTFRLLFKLLDSGKSTRFVTHAPINKWQLPLTNALNVYISEKKSGIEFFLNNTRNSITCCMADVYPSAYEYIHHLEVHPTLIKNKEYCVS